MVLGCERAQGSHMIGVIKEGLREIEYVPPEIFNQTLD
jgi:hypothetical protein